MPSALKIKLDAYKTIFTLLGIEPNTITSSASPGIEPRRRSYLRPTLDKYMAGSPRLTLRSPDSTPGAIKIKLKTYNRLFLARLPTLRVYILAG